MKTSLWIGLVLAALLTEENVAQRSLLPPLSPNSLRQIVRAYFTVPEGRSSNLNDIMLLHFTNSTEPASYRLRVARRLRSNPNFDPDKPTVLYAHGYIEFTTDDSVRTVVKGYQQNGGYNILVLDWANIAFGGYLTVLIGLQAAGAEVAKAMLSLIRDGLPRESLHFVGHSMGVHVLAAAARDMAAAGVKVPRLTGLDAAYPGFYPHLPLLRSASATDAEFVDMIHTDGGGYGAPHSVGHADFWPNGGIAKQPGCVSATLFLTSEDFCSHWRSWAFWAEAVAGSKFWSRKCDDYDGFLRGLCQENPPVLMGPKSGNQLRGNFYFRTAAAAPYSLGKRGAE